MLDAERGERGARRTQGLDETHQAARGAQGGSRQEREGDQGRRLGHHGLLRGRREGARGRRRAEREGPGRARRDDRDRPPDRGARPRREREARGVPRGARQGGRGPREGRRDAREGPVDQRREAVGGPGGADPVAPAEPGGPGCAPGREEARGVCGRGPEGPARERPRGDRPMKAVVLAGGEGTRLKPLTYKRPKPLMPVAGRPCIDFVLRSLASAGFHEIVVTAGYLSETLIKSSGDGFDYNASILYSFEENPAGTAGAVRRIGNFIDDTFVVAMGDVLCDVDFKALHDFHKRKGGAVTIALTEVEDPRPYGVVGLDSNGRIAKFKEKPPKEEAFSNLVNAGIYVLEPEVLEVIPTDQKFDFAKDLFPKLLSKGVPLYGSKLDGIWMDIGRPIDLWKASMEIVRREGKPLHRANVKSEGPVILDPAAVLEAGA